MATSLSVSAPVPTEKQLKEILKNLRYLRPNVTAKHLCAVMESFTALRPSVREHALEGSGRKVDLMQLLGTIPVSISGTVYHIPIRIWLQLQYPKQPPLLYVNPTGRMTIATSPGYVLADGMVKLSYLDSWKEDTSDVTTLVQYTRARFSLECPVYMSPRPQPSPSTGDWTQSSEREKELRAENDRLQSELNTVKQESQRQIESLKSENNSLLLQLDAATVKLIDARCTIVTLKAMKRKLKQSLDSKGTELAELRQQLQELQDQVSTDSTLQPREDFHQGPQQLIDESELREKVEQLEKELQQMSSERQELLSSFLPKQIESELKEKVEKLEKELQQMSSERQELLSSFLQHIQHNSEIEAQMEDLQKRLEEAEKSTSIISYTEVDMDTQRMLGTGAWGYVVGGRFRGKVVAIKCLHQSIVSEFTVSYLLREVKIMANLRHPNLVLFIAAAMDSPSGPIIVTELLTKTLREAYMDNSIGTCQVPVLHDVACALNYLHLQEKPIIHRDVSSSNVLLEELPDGKWRGKLSDFGSANLARLATTPGPGAMVYAAPEMRMSAEQTPAVDAYSYGVLVCEVATGAFPQQGQLQGMLNLTQSQWPDLYDIVKCCILEKPEERLSMGEIITKLDTIIKTTTAN